MNHFCFLRPIPLALFALLAFSSPLCRAGDSAERPDPNVISVDFPGGPLSQLVANLNANKDAKLSIIQSAGLDPVLPAFSVRNVHIIEVIAALGRIVEPLGYQLSPTGPNLAVLSRNERPTSQDFASFQLGSKLGDGKVEDIIAAIQLGCEFAGPNGKSSTLRFRYHPGTKLLFVAGTEREIGIARQVYDSLPGYPPKQPIAAPDAK